MSGPATGQRAFAAALLDLRQPVPQGLRVPAGVDAARRFAVHRNSVMTGLVDALADAFPVTRALLGDGFFRAMARERVRRDPPRSAIVAEYGAGFAAFIQGFDPAAGLPWLADLARLEYLRTSAYHAADATPLDPAAFRCVVADPLRLAATRLVLHPACRWMPSRFAVRSIWAAHAEAGDDDAVDIRAIDVDRGEDILVTRPHREVEVHALPPGGIALLDGLRDGLALGEAMVRAAGLDAQRLQTLFETIVRHGLATALVSPSEYAHE